MHFKRAVCLLPSLVGLLIIPISAQVPADDFLRSSGKIYVVVAVLAVIFLMIIGYLVWLDRRLRRLENKLPNGKN